jgi:hypothetical protein
MHEKHPSPPKPPRKLTKHSTKTPKKVKSPSNSKSILKQNSKSDISSKSVSNTSSYHIRPTVKNINVLTIKEKIVVSCDFNVNKLKFNRRQTKKLTGLQLNKKEAAIIKELLKRVEGCSGFKKYKYTFLVLCAIIGAIAGIFWFILVIPVICLILLVILCINYTNLRGLLVEGVKKDMALL